MFKVRNDRNAINVTFPVDSTALLFTSLLFNQTFIAMQNSPCGASETIHSNHLKVVYIDNRQWNQLISLMNHEYTKFCRMSTHLIFNLQMFNTLSWKIFYHYYFRIRYVYPRKLTQDTNANSHTARQHTHILTHWNDVLTGLSGEHVWCVSSWFNAHRWQLYRKYLHYSWWCGMHYWGSLMIWHYAFLSFSFL